MAQEIVTWCDQHMDDDEYVKGRTHSLAVTRKTREVDLCEDCAKEVLGPVLELLEKYGRAPSSPPRAVTSAKPKAATSTTAGELWCPVEGCTYGKPFFDRSSVRAHVEVAHNEDLASLEGRAGVTVEGKPVVIYCEAKGCDAGFSTPQGRGAHNRFRHPELTGSK